MSEDAELLRRYAVEHSEAAFAELIQRHIDLVYSAALRLVNGDVHRAQDVTQQVFTKFARQAKRLVRHPAPVGWLYTTTRWCALRIIRAEQRRNVREQEANIMNELLRESTPEPEWAHLRPVLEEAMHELGEKDRHAVLLRFFQNKSLKEVGLALDLGENAARMRVDRALEKLRAALRRRGVAATATLASAIAANAVQVAPAGLAATITSGTLAAATGTTSSLTLLKYMIMTKLKFGTIAAVIAAGIAAPLIIQHRDQIKLDEQEATLRQQSEQLTRLTTENEQLAQLVAEAKNQSLHNLAAPPAHMTVPTAAPATDDSQTTNLLTRMLKGNFPKLSREQVEAYLKANHRDAASLLAMFRATGDSALLREALQKYPDDPRVNFAAVFEKGATPAELRQRLDAFEQSAPDNPLANYLSALDYFKSGQISQAVQELNSASGKAGFQDYSWDFVQNAEEAWRSAGYTEADTTMAATWELALPQLAQLKDLNQQIVNLANSYGQAGDTASAQTALQMDFDLGQQMGSSPTDPLISQLVGIAIERNALAAMDPNAPFGADGQTVQNELGQLTQERAAIKNMVSQMEQLQPTMSAQDWINYNERTKTFGEQNAMQWLLAKYGQK